MKRLFYRIANSFLIAWWMFKNPALCDEKVVEMIVSLYGLIFQTIEQKRPLMTQIGFVEINTGEEKVFATIWCGYGEESSPANRITELLLENKSLKAENDSLIIKIKKLENKK